MKKNDENDMRIDCLIELYIDVKISNFVDLKTKKINKKINDNARLTKNKNV